MGHGKIIKRIAIVLTGLACLSVLTIGVYPGVLNDLLFGAILLSFLVVPVVAVVTLVVIVVLALKGKLRKIAISWRTLGLMFLTLFLTYGLLRYYVPRRIAFALSRSAFEPFIAQAKPSEYQGTALNKRLGVYRVDQYAADPRGGVYFRVYSGGDGISPDRMSYGFAYQPNPKGTPFGATRYRVFPLGNDWYWFRASDDWF